MTEFFASKDWQTFLEVLPTIPQETWETFYSTLFSTLLALAIGAIASAVGIFLTRTFIDGIYRGLDRWNGRRQGAAVWWERI